MIIRTKNEEDFLRYTPGGVLGILSDATDGKGEAGDRNWDYVDFAVKVGNPTIELLVAVGFQTPGIGVIKSYLDDHVSISQDYEIKHETQIREGREERMERLLDSELKSVEISFKKNPQTYPELDTADAIRTLIDDSYRLKIVASLAGSRGAGLFR